MIPSHSHEEGSRVAAPTVTFQLAPAGASGSFQVSSDRTLGADEVVSDRLVLILIGIGSCEAIPHQGAAMVNGRSLSEEPLE
jgi:hypothetical protein